VTSFPASPHQIPWSGSKELATRISVCRLTFFGGLGDKEVLRNGAFVEGAMTMAGTPEQPSLWQDRIRLDEAFYRALCDHPVPVSETALKAIGPRSMTLDVYIWLAYRLHALKRDTEVSWLVRRVTDSAVISRPACGAM